MTWIAWRSLPVLAAAAAVSLLVAAPSEAAPSEQNCNPPSDEGEWVIENTHVICANRDITVSKIKVWEASTLELHEVNLHLDTAKTTGSSISVGDDVQGYVSGSNLVVKDSSVESLDFGVDQAISIGSHASLVVEESEIVGPLLLSITSQSSSALVANSIFRDGRIGVFDWGAPDVVVESNFFTNMSGAALHSTGSATTVLWGNTVVDCKYGIVMAYDATPSIEENTITGGQRGIGYDSSTGYFQKYNVTAKHNDIFDNRYGCQGCPVGDVSFKGDAESNWWGTNPPDATYIGQVDYIPWRTSPRHPERLPSPEIAALPASVSRGQSVTFDASGSQPSQDFGFLLESYEWTFGDGESATGNQVTHAYANLGSYDVTLRVRDEKGLSRTTHETIQVTNQLPSVEVALTSGYAGEDITATIDASDPDGDSVTTDIHWLRDGVVQGITDSTVPGSSVESTDTWTIHVTVDDGHGGQDTATVTVNIPNRKPNLEANLLPKDPVATDDLEASATAGDPDGDAVSLSYTWSQNGQVQTDLDKAVVPAGRVKSMDSWQVTITARDAHGSTNSVTRSVDIPNLVPSITNLNIQPAGAFATDNLEAVAAARDPDDDDVSLSYSWMRNGVLQEGLTGPLIAASHVRSTDTWSVTATARDVHGATAQATAEVVIPNRGPKITSLDVMPDIVHRGDELRALVETADADEDIVEVAYAWHRNGEQTEETGARVAGAHLVRGDSWRVTVTASDGHQEVSQTSTAILVQNTAPQVEALAIEASQAGEPVEAVVEAADGDGDDVVLQYAWRQNGEARNDLTGATVSGVEVVSGDSWSVTVTPRDDELVGEAVTVQAVIGNHAPVIESMTILPQGATASEPLHLDAVASDADGDGVTVSYQWLRNGEATDFTDERVEAVHLVKGDSWRVRVIATDGKSEVNRLSQSIVIQNTPPEILGVDVSPDGPRVTDVVVLAVEATDVDGDALTVTWSLPGGDRQGASIQTVFPSVGVFEVAYDVGDGEATIEGSLRIEVQADAPPIQALPSDDEPTDDDAGDSGGEPRQSVDEGPAGLMQGHETTAQSVDPRAKTRDAPLPWLLGIFALAWPIARRR